MEVSTVPVRGLRSPVTHPDLSPRFTRFSFPLLPISFSWMATSGQVPMVDPMVCTRRGRLLCSLPVAVWTRDAVAVLASRRPPWDGCCCVMWLGACKCTWPPAWLRPAGTGPCARGRFCAVRGRGSSPDCASQTRACCTCALQPSACLAATQGTTSGRLAFCGRAGRLLRELEGGSVFRGAPSMAAMMQRSRPVVPGRRGWPLPCAALQCNAPLRFGRHRHRLCASPLSSVPSCFSIVAGASPPAVAALFQPRGQGAPRAPFANLTNLLPTFTNLACCCQPCRPIAGE